MAAATNLLALDVGTVRIGIAQASSEVRMAHPLTTLANDTNLQDSLQKIIAEQQVGILVVGLPRNMQGEATAQTAYVETFVESLRYLELPIHFQDEALTSSKAETELSARGKPFSKGDVDALAATYILDDFLQTFSE